MSPMTDADLGLNYKKDFARLIMMLQSECSLAELQELMNMLETVNNIPDAELGCISKILPRPKELEGLI